MKFDLHLHTYFSDGKYSPEEIIDLALERQIKGISITDHDTIDGIESALEYSKRYTDFHVIPGIEFGSVYKDSEVHILGYFIDVKNRKLIETINFLKKSRESRGAKMVNRLKDLGFNIEYEDVTGMSEKDFIGRVPIAKTLMKKGYVSTIGEAFDKYLNRGKDAYIEKESLSIENTIDIIKYAGGISVLAHPGLLKDRQVIGYCIEKGIDGIECIHSKHTKEETDYLKKIADKHNLIITGGSDCHGEIINGDLLLGRYYINLKKVPQLKERIK